MHCTESKNKFLNIILADLSDLSLLPKKRKERNML